MTDAHRTPAAQFLVDNDMFANVPLENDSSQAAHTPALTDLLTFEGQLTHNAELRSGLSTDGLHAIPIVCLDLRSLDRKDRRRCQAHIPFTDATRPLAEACARQHKKGMVVKVASHTLDVCMTLPQAQIINSYTPS